MVKELFVQNVMPSVTEDRLRSLFLEAGEVAQIQRPIDRETKVPRKFAFVMMATEEEAARAIEKINGFELEGRTLVVREAEPRKGRYRPMMPRNEVLRVGAEIAEVLGETEKRPRAQIMRLLEIKGEEFSRQLLADTVAKQEDGGIEVLDGTRKRTLGGVYFKLAKDRLDEETRHTIFPNWRELKRRRKEKKAREAELAAKREAQAAKRAESKKGKGGGKQQKVSKPTRAPKPKGGPKEVTPEIEAKFLELREAEAVAQQHLADIQARRVKGSPIAALKELADLKAQVAQMTKNYPALRKLK